MKVVCCALSLIACVVLGSACAHLPSPSRAPAPPSTWLCHGQAFAVGERWWQREDACGIGQLHIGTIVDGAPEDFWCAHPSGIQSPGTNYALWGPLSSRSVRPGFPMADACRGAGPIPLEEISYYQREPTAILESWSHENRNSTTYVVWYRDGRPSVYERNSRFSLRFRSNVERYAPLGYRAPRRIYVKWTPQGDVASMSVSRRGRLRRELVLKEREDGIFRSDTFYSHQNMRARRVVQCISCVGVRREITTLACDGDRYRTSCVGERMPQP